MRRDLGQVPDDESDGDAAQIEALAAGEDGGQDLLRLGGGEHELHMRGGFLEGLEEGVERLLGQHVDFVDDVNLEPARWPERI